MILAIAVLVTSLSSFASEENVNAKVLSAFKNDFNTAKEVEWSAGRNYYKAAFIYNDRHVFAYYNQDGELLGLSRYISPDDLPLSLQADLKKSYNKYWISDLFEASKSSGTSYYITLENADTKIILRASADSDWSLHEKIRKA